MLELAQFLLVLVTVVVGLFVLRSTLQRITVYEYQQGLKYRDGRFVGLVGPGRHWLYRPSTTVHVVDTRLSVVAIGGQEVVTSDGISIKISLAVQLRLADPVVALHGVDDYHAATYSLVQVALREKVGAMPIDELLQHRDAIGPEVLQLSVDQARAIGVELVAVAVKDLMFTGPTKRLFAQVIEARQHGLASLERARGETAALRSLANAARMVDTNPSLMQLRLLQQLETTSGNTVVLGMPTTSTPLPLRPASTTGSAPALESGAGSPQGSQSGEEM